MLILTLRSNAAQLGLCIWIALLHSPLLIFRLPGLPARNTEHRLIFSPVLKRKWDFRWSLCLPGSWVPKLLVIFKSRTQQSIIHEEQRADSRWKWPTRLNACAHGNEELTSQDMTSSKHKCEPWRNFSRITHNQKMALSLSIRALGAWSYICTTSCDFFRGSGSFASISCDNQSQKHLDFAPKRTLVAVAKVALFHWQEALSLIRR